MLKHKIKKVWIDYDECLAHQFCVLETPNIFEERDDELYPQTKLDIKKLLNKETENIFSAAANCPVAAIKLELESGDILDGNSEFIIKFEKTRPKNA